MAPDTPCQEKPAPVPPLGCIVLPLPDRDSWTDCVERSVKIRNIRSGNVEAKWPGNMVL